MRQPELSSKRSYHVAWTIVIHCFTACLTPTSDECSRSRMPPLDSLLEFDGGNTSHQCCASCTGFQSRLELTLNSHVLSSCLCLAMHHRTYLTTYIWSRKGLDVACVCLLIDRVLFHAHTTHSVTEVSLSRGLVSGIASQDTYATKISPTAASGVNSNISVFLQPGRNVTSCLIARYKYSY